MLISKGDCGRILQFVIRNGELMGTGDMSSGQHCPNIGKIINNENVAPAALTQYCGAKFWGGMSAQVIRNGMVSYETIRLIAAASALIRG